MYCFLYNINNLGKVLLELLSSCSFQLQELARDILTLHTTTARRQGRRREIVYVNLYINKTVVVKHICLFPFLFLSRLHHSSLLLVVIISTL